MFRNGNANDGMAAAEHLLAALMYSSGKWYRNNPTVEVVFKNPAKGMLTARTSYEVAFREGMLAVRRSARFTPDWIRTPMLKTRSPREALDAMARDAQGYIVKVGVECKDGGGGGANCSGTCDDATFWDIKFERQLNKQNNGGKANKSDKTKGVMHKIAAAAANRL